MLAEVHSLLNETPFLHPAGGWGFALLLFYLSLRYETDA